jgi:hypothetical protein
MKRLIIALIVGVAMGYRWGYTDGDGGKGTVVNRALERFGTSKVKAMQEAHDKRVDEASRP